MSDLFSDLQVEKSVPDGIVLGFEVNRQELDKALTAVGALVPNKHLIPVLTNFHLRFEDLDLRITGSDKAVSAIQHVECLKGSKQGSAVFNAPKLQSIVREAAGETLIIKVTSKKNKQSCTIVSGAAKWQFNLDSVSQFPDFSDDIEAVELVETERLPFLNALTRVRKSVSQDAMRPYLMMVDIAGGRMRSSDSNRFQQVKFKFPFDCQIPTRAVNELVSRLVGYSMEHIEVGQTDQHLLYRFGKLLLIAQKNTAQFPDIEEVMLKPVLSNDQDLLVDRKALLSAIKRTRITADENTSAVILSLNKGSVTVQTKDHVGGVSIDSVDATWDHPPRHVSFNHLYLTDLLSSTNSETCVFRLGKDLKTKPTSILMEDESEGFTAVLSQIRVDWMED